MGKLQLDINNWSISIPEDGKMVAVGSTGNLFSHIRIYSWEDWTWRHIGNDIYGVGADFSWNLATSGNGTDIAIAAP